MGRALREAAHRLSAGGTTCRGGQASDQLTVRGMLVESSLIFLKLGLFSFWGLWFVMVFCTNLFEGCKVLHIAPWTWQFASHNFEPVRLATAEYDAPSWVPTLLFSGIMLWQLLIVTLFGWAIVSCLTNQALT